MDEKTLRGYRLSSYAKPYFFVDEQLAKLYGHGLDIEDYELAKATLRKIGYFRFAGYAYFFKTNGAFREGTTFAQVVDLYRFDELMRNKLIEGLEMIEVWLRSQLSNRLGFYHPFAHRFPVHLRKNVSIWTASQKVIKQSKHIEWIADYSREERRSQGDCVQHFRSKYGPHLPVWAATEIMTLGTICRLFDLLHEEDRALIAARAGIVNPDGKGDQATFSSWLNHFRYLRNVCAHYGRVWNKVFDTTLAAPKGAIDGLSDFKTLPHKLYKTIAAIRFIFTRVYPDSQWSDEMLELIEAYTHQSNIPMHAMGFPVDWRERPIWNGAVPPDLEACLLIDCVNQVECVTQARLLETVFPDRNEKGKKDFLRYLRDRKGIFLHEVGGTKYYPVFQFNEDLTGIDSNVGNVNEILITKFVGSTHGIQLVQDWWANGQSIPGLGVAPMKKVKESPELVFEAAQKLVAN
ncbi:Abi family protein [Corynebacterium riegelii]|uniref:Abi family protein n=1 Tax=Corynebacterium riegelii TaxID=156976 RepID=UPI0023F7EB73|nr:Abi family protein [Corynebacterium riegelii]